MGPTVMKMRHLRWLGYKTASIPLHSYSMSAGLESKAAHIRAILDEAFNMPATSTE